MVCYTLTLFTCNVCIVSNIRNHLIQLTFCRKSVGLDFNEASTVSSADCFSIGNTVAQNQQQQTNMAALLGAFFYWCFSAVLDQITGQYSRCDRTTDWNITTQDENCSHRNSMISLTLSSLSCTQRLFQDSKVQTTSCWAVTYWH